MRRCFGAICVLAMHGCATRDLRREAPHLTGGSASQRTGEPFVMVLGIAQDGGLPHAGCRRACCASAWEDARLRVPTACLGIVDPAARRAWMIDATPDFPSQLNALRESAQALTLNGVLLTHAHIGHYAGLIHLGREVMGADGVPVYVMPRMRRFLETNGPWEQLVKLNNVELRSIAADQPVSLGDHVRVTPLLVPHRDEYSETVAFSIEGPRRRVLYLPDIDKWERWDRRIEDLLAQVDAAFIDGTFFTEGELPGRNAAEVPHPRIEESLRRFEELPARERDKVHFIHLNHTNPAIRARSPAARQIEAGGCHVARVGQVVPL